MNVNQVLDQCEKCEYHKHIYAQYGFRFIGCYHEPYHGKWVAEIKECPKESEDTE